MDLSKLKSAKYFDGGPVLCLSQFSILPQLPPKNTAVQKWSKLIKSNHLTVIVIVGEKCGADNFSLLFLLDVAT
jgi:hypothetical protein